MKVIYVLHSHKAGGAERHLLDLMHGTAALGVEPIYAGPMDGWLGAQAEAAGVRCHHLPYHGLYDMPSLLRLARLARREHAALIHGHLTRGAYYAGWAGRLAGRPSVATAHSTNAGKHFGRAARIIAVSDAVRRFLIERGYDAGRIVTVHNGVPDATANAPSREAARAALGLAPTQIALIMVARFIPDKGHDIALDALAHHRDAPWTLLLAGAPDGPTVAPLRKRIAALGLTERVRFLGHLDDVAPLYAAADALLAPSRREAFSLTLLEAAAWRLPVIASTVGGNGEAVVDGVTGLLTPPDDVPAFAAALGRLLADGAEREALGKRARARYLESFTCATMCASTRALYADALSDRQP